MSKIVSFAAALTLFASSAAASNIVAPHTAAGVDTTSAIGMGSHSGMDMAGAYTQDAAIAALQHASSETNLGSDLISASPVILTSTTGTHVGVDMAAAYAEVKAVSYARKSNTSDANS